MKLIVGLGNPGEKYNNTRHNVGFMVLDYIVKDLPWTKKFNAYYCTKRINNEVIIFVKPLTYMNLSGYSVKKYIDYFDIDIEDLLVIHDDLDSNFGTHKLKKNSSSGGHNGIKSIIEQLNTNSFLRLKIGIKNEKIKDARNFVLDKFSKEELVYLNNRIELYGNIVESFIIKGVEYTMNIYNRK